MELRDYQNELLEQVRSAVQESQDSRVMLQLPTGGGKTRIAGELLSLWLKDGRKAVWLTHRRELAAQTEGMLQQDDVSATKDIHWTPGVQAPAIPNSVVILMAQTVSRRTDGADVWDRYDDRDLMIIDEVHHATADGWARAIKQWPGPVLGMTATPWRLSQREGFDHLFWELICGPQVAELQKKRSLCNARVLSPPEDELVQSGHVDSTGEYSEPGIEEANRDRDVWTAGALRYWQKHGENRQTVVYAVSVKHARNLADVFNEGGIPAGVLLSDTPSGERDNLIRRFRQGDLKALINVAVATEGFDLPDAACVLMTRPTMSLALYLQMVGRGLRPKQGDGDCAILDLAGNSRRHGLPEEDRKWSLRARGEQPSGDARLVRCEKCEALSPAASHQCGNCGEPFGENCGRCGAWRALKRWTRKTMCDQDHELVCDRCHYDAHVLANLPVTQELEELAIMMDDDGLSPYRNPYIKDLLEEEWRRINGAADDRKGDLRRSVEQLELDLRDDERMDRSFERYLDSLTDSQRPASKRQRSIMYAEWENRYKAELEALKEELAELEAQSIDGQLVLRNVRELLLRLLEAEAREAGLIRGAITQEGVPQQPSVGNSLTGPPHSGKWLTFIDLMILGKSGSTRDYKPRRFRDPRGKEKPLSSWISLLRETSEWFISEGSLTKDVCPVAVEGKRSSYLIHNSSILPNGRNFKHSIRLSNGLYLDSNLSSKSIAGLCASLVKRFGEYPEQFHVQL